MLDFSIALATFNGERHLQEQLESLTDQTSRPAELVVCDDGSTDRTIALLRDFAQSAPFPVRIVQNSERLGYRANFMKAASMCKSRLIAFCDQDDIWLPNKLRLLQDRFQTSDCIAVSHDFSVFFEDGRRPITSYYQKLSNAGFAPIASVKGCSLAFRRDLLTDFGWPRSGSVWSHDLWICLLSTALERRDYIFEPLIRHRIHSSNTSGWLIEERGNVRKWLRRAHIPPFTSKSPLDTFLGSCVGLERDAQAEAIVLSGCAAHLSAAQTRYIAEGFRRRESIFRFLVSEEYKRRWPRMLAASRLFLSQAYRDGDGLPGLVADLFGRRHLEQR